MDLKYNKIFFLLMISVFLFGFSFNVLGATLNVPGDYSTIQSAIDATVVGDTINVAAGTYNENVAINSKSNIVIQGVGDTTIIEPASGIGFAITNSNGITIKSLKIHTTGENAHGTWVGGEPNGYAAMNGLTIQDTTIVVDGYSAGIYAEQVTPAHSSWLIGGEGHGNTITINSGTGVTGDGLDLLDVSDSEVSYNSITLNNPTDSTNVFWDSELSNIDNLIFSHNTVSGSSGSEVAFLNDAWGLGSPDTTTNSVTISGNTFSNWGSRALRINSGVTDVDINNNIFEMTSDTTEVIGGTGEGSATGTGNTFNVNSPAKIQKAIDNAFPGDTINVVAGTYTENVNVNKELTLKGASSATVSVTAANSAVSVITITANNVDISGFTVSGATGGGQAGIFIGAGVTGNNIHNNILTGSFDGIWLGSGSNHNTLTNNIANSNTRQGFEVYISSYNTFTNNIANSNTKYGFKIDSGDHNTFINNTANSNTGLGNTDGKGFYSVAGDGGGSTNSIFINNTANLNKNHGMHLIGSNIGVTLTGNNFNGNLVTGVKLQDVVTNLNMQNNKITNNPTGIGIDSSVSVIGLTVKNNNIAGNTVKDVSNLGTGTLDATKNYWGTATPDASLFSGNVNYKPWFKNEDLTELDLSGIGAVGNGDGTQNITLPTEVEFNVETSLGTVEVSIPTGTIITGDVSWTGILNAPTLKLTSSITVTPSAGNVVNTVDSVIEVGFSGLKLTFDKAVRLLIPGQAGKLVGYSVSGTDFTPITTICLDDTQATNDLLPNGGDCKRDVDSDLVIWTRHFTNFATYTEVAAPATTTGAGAGGGGGAFTPITPTELTNPPFAYPDCNTDAECNAGETCKYVFGEYYKQCVATTTETIPTTPTTPTAGATTTPTGLAAITGAVIGAFKGTTGQGILVALVIVALGLGSYFYLRKPRIKAIQPKK